MFALKEKSTFVAKRVTGASKAVKQWANAKVASLVTLAAVMVATAPAHAATGIDELFDEIDISGIAAKVLALAVVIVGIALVIKGPAIVKRIISKI